MARPSVPHCKNCSSLLQLPHSNPWGYGYLRCERNSWKCLDVGEWINGQEIRTSPKWCPRRRSAKTSKPGSNA